MTPTVTLTFGANGALTLQGPPGERLDSVTIYQNATDYPGKTRIALGSGRQFDQSSTTTAQNPSVVYEGTNPASANAALVTTGSLRYLTVDVGGRVRVDDTVLTLNDGYIHLKGHGEDNATGADLYGVEIESSQLTATGSGDIKLEGTGGSGTRQNFGVYLWTPAGATRTSVTTANADLIINGTGQGTADRNIGVNVVAATVSATGTGSVRVTGTGGNGTFYNYGVSLDVPAELSRQTEVARFTAASGGLYIEGTANGSQNENYGITVTNGSEVSGQGVVSLKGTGGQGSFFNFGVSIYTQLRRGNRGISKVLADGANASVYIEGRGRVHANLGPNDEGNYGIDMEHNGTVEGKNGASVKMVGYSAAGWWKSHGIVVEWGASVVTDSGSIEMTGYGYGGYVELNGVPNQLSSGIVLFWSPPLDSTYSYLPPSIRSTSGSVTLTGYGGTTPGGGNHGLDFESTSVSTVMTIEGSTVILVGHPGHQLGSWAIYIHSSVRLELHASKLTIVPEGGSLSSDGVINNAQAIEIIARLDFNLPLPDILRVDAPVSPVPVLRMLDHYAGDQAHEATYTRHAHDEAPNDTTRGYFLVTYPPEWGRGIERIDYFGMQWDGVVL